MKQAIPAATFGELAAGARFIAAPVPGRVYTADEPAFVFMKLAPPVGGFNSVNLTTASEQTWLDTEAVIPVAT